MSNIVFPKDFVWGVASSAYQIEGAWNKDGKGVSIWDTFTHIPGKIINNENGDVAIDHYHHYKEDVELMAELGLRHYRFSTAWTRILPSGSGAVNPKGVAFYDRLIDTLLKHKIKPYLCLFHWDLPQALQDKGGWANRDTARLFAEYARVVAHHFGDRLDVIITHNEPWVAAFAGYYEGMHAPGIKDIGAAIKAQHHLLLSHGLAAQAIRSEAKKPIQVGIVLNFSPVYPASNNRKDIESSEWADFIHVTHGLGSSAQRHVSAPGEQAV